MTDPTPATEAGRRLTEDYHNFPPVVAGILAIEAEAREQGCTDDQGSVYYEQGWKAGRADALREAAERVRALDDVNVSWPSATHVSRAAVLAILAGKTE